MSLINDVKAYYAEGYSLPPHLELGDGFDADYVDRTVVEEKRWGDLVRWVYQRGDEFVAVEDVEPATEMQGWGDYGGPDIYHVRPHTETVVVTTYTRA